MANGEGKDADAEDDRGFGQDADEGAGSDDNVDEAEISLAWDASGNPIDVPDEADGWRVSWRKLGERGGSASLVYHNGRPLILPIDATHADLIERVVGKKGKYRLEPVDERGHVIKDAPIAYSTIERDIRVRGSEAPPPAAANDDDQTGRMLASIEQLVRTNTEVMVALVHQISPCLNGAANLISTPDRRRRVEYIETAPAVVASGEQDKGFDWQTAMAAFMPMAQQAFQMWMNSLQQPPKVIGQGPDGQPILGR